MKPIFKKFGRKIPPINQNSEGKKVNKIFLRGGFRNYNNMNKNDITLNLLARDIKESIDHEYSNKWNDIKISIANLSTTIETRFDILAANTKNEIDNLAVQTKNEIDKLAAKTSTDIDGLKGKIFPLTVVYLCVGLVALPALGSLVTLLCTNIDWSHTKIAFKN